MQKNKNTGTFTRPLCQYTFDAVDENCHPGCPVGLHCHAVKCPDCGYKFIEHSSIISFFGKLFQKRKIE